MPQTEFLSIFGEDLDEVDIFHKSRIKNEQEEPRGICDFLNQ